MTPNAQPTKTMPVDAKLLNVVVDAVPVALVALDVGRRVILWNHTAETMFGWSAREVIGHVPPCLPEAGRSVFEDLVQRAARGETVTAHDLRGERRDGTPIDLGLSVAALHDETGTVVGTIAMAQPATAHGTMDAASWYDSISQRENLVALSTLVAGVAHEMNNPLTVVLGHAEILEQTVADPTIAERVGKIVKAGQQCLRVVKNFLSLARRHPPARRSVELNRVIADALELLMYQLRVDDVDVALELADDLPTVWADPHQVHQVVVNLLMNAWQAVRRQPPPRRVRITTEADRDREHVRLRVADNGPGIPRQLLGQIFEPFFTTKPSGEGTGLGLAICRAIVERHQGTIEVGRSSSGGAVFVVDLPVTQEPVPVPAPAPTTVDTPRSGRALRILVVDDEADVADVLAEMLRMDGHVVRVALSGRDALAALRAGDYDAVLSDIRMPDLDGPGLYRAIASERPALTSRLIFLTGDVLGRDAGAFLASTGVPSLKKPFVPDDVRAAVRGLVDRLSSPSRDPRG